MRAGSAAQNYAAADVTSPRSVAAYVVPPLFLALVVDRVVAVVRRHVLGDAEGSVWAMVGRALAVLARAFAVVLLYGLRFLLAPPSTGAGLRRVVLNATPLPAAPARRSSWPPMRSRRSTRRRDRAARAGGREQEGPPCLVVRAGRRLRRSQRTAEAAKRLAPKVDLSEGTARAYLGAILEARAGRHDRRRAVIGALLVSCSPHRRPGPVRRHHRYTALVALVAIAAAVLFYRWVLSRARRSGAGPARCGGASGSACVPVRGSPRWPSSSSAGPARLRCIHGGRIRPGLGYWARVFSPVTGYAVRLGRAQYFRRVFARREDQTLILAPQRTGKSGIIADRLLDHPGPAVVTTTRADLYLLTAGARSQRGPVYVFNPQGVGGLPSTFAFDLLAPCADLVMARRMALADRCPGQRGRIHGNLEWFENAADAAMTGCSTRRPSAATPSPTCTPGLSCKARTSRCASWPAGRGTSCWSPRCGGRSRPTGPRASIRESMALSLAWATIPQMAAAATPRPGEGFDLAEFVASNGTLYLIAAVTRTPRWRPCWPRSSAGSPWRRASSAA